MRRNDPKVETIRELISLPSETEALLRAFALKSSEEKMRVDRVIEFRRRVGQEFEKLVRASR